MHAKASISILTFSATFHLSLSWLELEYSCWVWNKMTLLGVKPDMQDYRRKRSCLSPMINCSGQVLGLGLLVPLSFYPHLLDLAEVYFLSMFDVLLLKTRVCARNVWFGPFERNWQFLSFGARDLETWSEGPNEVRSKAPENSGYLTLKSL